MMEYPRPESRPTILFGDAGLVDENPFVTSHNRPIAGPDFSERELTHLQRIAARSGETLDLFRTPTTEQLGRISLNAVMGCWELHVSEDKTGTRARYGHLSVAGVSDSALAHRTMYRVFYGIDALPNGPEGTDLFLDHLCQNKSCCYPRHLEIVSILNNNLRARIKHSPGQLELTPTSLPE